MNTTFRLTATIAAALLLAACGNKGPLVMPQKPVPMSLPTPAPPPGATTPAAPDQAAPDTDEPAPAAPAAPADADG
ncbi:lipoprotein [Pseudoxanthomonas koreensis]|uniref:LPS translocon maturation chaperone LptM n=1 Tax=Pseudoxanthomonas koreensis TaxID=266061 RepID=UPI0035A6E5AF